MKLFIIAFTSVLSFAQIGTASTTPCVAKIATGENWAALSQEQIECMENSSDFASAVKTLCLTDESEISITYAKFLDYKVKIAEAFAKFQAATNPGDRTLANYELQDLKRAQSSYGIANGIWAALDSIDRAKYSCEQ